ncbi:hypothetical protein SNE40_000142 [Patella caerulea]|uniref:Uncharacterized protein n=1 Tax=Patella caerulea TaxID=87958 RepID=A0AAN8K9W8_PATCE
MSTTENNFRVESLLHSLKEVQNEKCCMERKLTEQRNKRRNMEREFETVNMKLIQVTDIHHKMMETMKIAQLKVSQTQAQADSLEEGNEKRRGKIADLNRRIEREKEKQNTEVAKFEEELSELASKLMTARNCHKDDHLEETLKNLESEKRQLGKHKNLLKSEVDKLAQTLESITLQQRLGVDYPDINEETRRQIWQLFKEEHCECKDYLNKLSNEVDDVQTQLHLCQQ